MWVRVPFGILIYLVGYGVAVAARLQDSVGKILMEEAPVALPLVLVLGWRAIVN